METPEFSAYPETPKKKFPVWAIVLIVFVLLCCCCSFFGGAYWLYNNYDNMGDPFGIYGLLPVVTSLLA